jgi:predicted peroxiredoxin/TusA-related sulfurtransferase
MNSLKNIFCRTSTKQTYFAPITIFFLIILLLAILYSGCATQKQNMEVKPMSTMTAHDTIDLRGKTISTYVLYHTVQKLKQMHTGETLEVVTDNYEALQNDMNAWTRMTGHILKGSVNHNDYHTYYIEKSNPIKRDSKLAIVISNKGMLELLSPLGFSLAAALEGIDVHLYFQGPGVKVLKKGYKAKLPGLGRPFSKAARNGLAKAGHLSPQDKLHQLKASGAHIYVCGPSMDHYKVKKEELIFDDIIVAEYLTFTEVFHDADIQIYVQ